MRQIRQFGDLVVAVFILVAFVYIMATIKPSPVPNLNLPVTVSLYPHAGHKVDYHESLIKYRSPHAWLISRQGGNQIVFITRDGETVDHRGTYTITIP
jgi:hypothetical protein